MEETVLIANISRKVILGMLFVSFNNANIWFTKRGHFSERNYLVPEALATTNKVGLINKKKCTKGVLDKNAKIFVIYVAILLAILIHPSQEALHGLLLADDACPEVPTQYFGYTEVFSLDLVIELPEYTNINNHAIEFEKGKQSAYGLIYSLIQV